MRLLLQKYSGSYCGGIDLKYLVLRPVVAAALLVGVSIVSSPAKSADYPWYVSGSAGTYLRQDVTRSAETPFAIGGNSIILSSTNTTSYDPGEFGSIAVGRALVWGFRSEAELDFAHYSPSSFTPSPNNGNTLVGVNGTKFTANSGAYNRFMGSVNLFWDAPLKGYLKPYVGAGVGFATDSGSTATYTNPNGFTFNQYAAQSTAPIVLGEVGLAVALSPRWSIVPAYRYIHFFNSGGTVEEAANIFKLGVRFNF